MRVLLVLFVITPIIEMWLLISVGGVIGALPTIALVLLTACMGLALLRHQGSEALLRARDKMQANQLPAREIADSLFFAVGGALLLTPGFVTDAIGFACLTPGIRTIVIRFIANNVIKSGHIHAAGFGAAGHSTRSSQYNDGSIIEGDFERASESDLTKIKSGNTKP